MMVLENIIAAPMIKSAIQSMQKASDNAGGAGSDEMPIKFLYAGVVGGGLALTGYLATDLSYCGLYLLATVTCIAGYLAACIYSQTLRRNQAEPANTKA